MKKSSIKTTACAALSLMTLLTAGTKASAQASLYVVNEYEGTSSTNGYVSIYDPGSSGTVSPIATISGSNTQIVDPWSITIDGSGNIYVQNLDSGGALTNTFASGTTGNATPIRSFYNSLGIRDGNAIAVDSQGYVYEIKQESGGGVAALQVYAPAASGGTNALVTIYYDGSTPTLSGRPVSLAVDDTDHVYVGVASSTNAVQVYKPQLTGTGPIRTLTGTSTQLGGGDGRVPYVAFSAATTRLYVGVGNNPLFGSGTAAGAVCVFDQHANGNTAPLRVISGSSTQLPAGVFISGLAVNPSTSEINVLTSSGFTTSGQVLVFNRLANGNVSPLRTITDSTSGFQAALGIAFH
jgi:hypothetical protein